MQIFERYLKLMIRPETVHQQFVASGIEGHSFGGQTFSENRKGEKTRKGTGLVD
jgi:hypothetical protein